MNMHFVIWRQRKGSLKALVDFLQLGCFGYTFWILAVKLWWEEWRQIDFHEVDKVPLKFCSYSAFNFGSSYFSSKLPTLLKLNPLFTFVLKLMLWFCNAVSNTSDNTEQKWFSMDKESSSALIWNYKYEIND